MLQGRKVSFGLLKDLGDWYRTLMSVAVCCFFAWINFTARSFAQRTGKAKKLRKKRLEVQAKHKHGPVYVTASELHKTGAVGCLEPGSQPVDGRELHASVLTGGSPNASQSEDSGVPRSQLRHRLDSVAEAPE